MTHKYILFIFICQLAGLSLAQVSHEIELNQRGEIEILPLLMAAKNHDLSKLATNTKVKKRETLAINDHFYEWPVKSVQIDGEHLVFMVDSPEDASKSRGIFPFPLFISQPPKLEELLACATTQEVVSVLLKNVQDIEAEKRILKEWNGLDWLEIPDLVPENLGSLRVCACYLYENRVIGVRFHAFSDRNGIKDGDSVLLRQSCKIWASAPIDR